MGWGLSEFVQADRNLEFFLVMISNWPDRRRESRATEATGNLRSLSPLSDCPQTAMRVLPIIDVGSKLVSNSKSSQGETR